MTAPVTFPSVPVDSKRAKAGVMGFLSMPAARVAMEALGSCGERRMCQPLFVHVNMERAIIGTQSEGKVEASVGRISVSSVVYTYSPGKPCGHHLVCDSKLKTKNNPLEQNRQGWESTESRRKKGDGGGRRGWL